MRTHPCMLTHIGTPRDSKTLRHSDSVKAERQRDWTALQNGVPKMEVRAPVTSVNVGPHFHNPSSYDPNTHTVPGMWMRGVVKAPIS